MTLVNPSYLSKSKILVLHPNFPGQFVDIAHFLGKKGADVLFLCQTHYDRQLPNVKRVTLKNALGSKALEAMKLSGFEKTMALANQYKQGMQELNDKGWSPDLIISHSGFGCGLHSSYIWPKSIKIAYVEWWFNKDCILYKLDKKNKWWNGPTFDSKMRERNMCLAYELMEAHKLITPTKWQHQQLPTVFRNRCAIISEGVSHAYFKPSEKEKNSKPLITYGTRGMEAMKGFPEFIEELPKVLELNQELIVEIAGEDRICYGGSPPLEGSYGKWAKKVLRKWINEGRVVFLGSLNYEEYRRWLQRSWIHIHLTRPFVSSWSLLEAMACGCYIISSDSPNSREFLDDSCALLINHRKPGWLNKSITRILYDQKEKTKVSHEVVKRSLRWSKLSSLQKWETSLEEALEKSGNRQHSNIIDG